MITTFPSAGWLHGPETRRPEPGEEGTDLTAENAGRRRAPQGQDGVSPARGLRVITQMTMRFIGELLAILPGGNGHGKHPVNGAEGTRGPSGRAARELGVEPC